MTVNKDNQAQRVARNLYRDTWMSLRAIAFQASTDVEHLRTYFKTMALRREPKYPRPLYHGVLYDVALPESDSERTLRVAKIYHSPASGAIAFDRRRATALWDQGVGIEAIAARLGRPRVTIRKWLKATGANIKAPCLAPLPPLRINSPVVHQRKSAHGTRWRAT